MPDAPFSDALRALMESREVSFRRLSDATGRYRDPGLSPTYLQHLTSGRARPTADNMEVIAKALGVTPRTFVEYREHVAAQEAKRIMGEVGLEKVLEALNAIAADGGARR